VIEDLFKKNILFLVFLSIICTQNNNSYIINNILPSELSKNNFGIQLLNDNDNKVHTYFNHQAWITENLSIDNYVSSSFNNSIDIAYGFNFGYGSIFENQHLKKIIYCIGYHRKKYTEYDFKLSNFSINSMIKLRNNWLSLSVNSFFNKKGNSQMKNYLLLQYMKSFKKNIIINTGIQLYKNDNTTQINYLMGFNYSL